MGMVALQTVRKKLLERMDVWVQGLLHRARLTFLECRSDRISPFLPCKAKRDSGLDIWIAQ